MHGNTIITQQSQEKEVATQRQTLRHVEDIGYENFYLDGCYTCYHQFYVQYRLNH